MKAEGREPEQERVHIQTGKERMGGAKTQDTGWGQPQVGLKRTTCVRWTPSRTQALVGEGHGGLLGPLFSYCLLGRDELLRGERGGDLTKGPSDSGERRGSNLWACRRTAGSLDSVLPICPQTADLPLTQASRLNPSQARFQEALVI